MLILTDFKQSTGIWLKYIVYCSLKAIFAEGNKQIEFFKVWFVSILH